MCKTLIVKNFIYNYFSKKQTTVGKLINVLNTSVLKTKEVPLKIRYIISIYIEITAAVLPYKSNQNRQNRQNHQSAVGNISQIKRQALQFLVSY